jgi:hypothetical protein
VISDEFRLSLVFLLLVDGVTNELIDNRYQLRGIRDTEYSCLYDFAVNKTYNPFGSSFHKLGNLCNTRLSEYLPEYLRGAGLSFSTISVSLQRIRPCCLNRKNRCVRRQIGVVITVSPCKSPSVLSTPTNWNQGQ